MDTVVSASGGRGRRGSQDETSPFPLEFMVARPLGQSQDETSPFPLDFMVIARKRRASQDETAPFPLEYEVTQLEGDDGAVRIQRSASRHTERAKAEPAKAEPQPRRTVSELEVSARLREYAARVAAGEALPPYRGPILASEEPSSNAGKAIIKLALGVMLMMAALVATAVGGDDATLRAAGAAIGGWFTGNDGSFESFPLNVAPSDASPSNASQSSASSCPCNERPEAASQKP